MIPQELKEKIDSAGRSLQLAAKMSKEYYGKPLIVTYSGGKDSDALLQVALEYLQPEEFEVLNSHTTVDAPETVYHIREVFEMLEGKGVHTEVRMPEYKGEPTTMWKLIVAKQIPPTRIQRYCCQVLKESATPHRFIATGVREDESPGRRGRNTFSVRGKTAAEIRYYSLDHCEEVFDEAMQDWGPAYDCTFITAAKEKRDLITNPIYEWTLADVWDFGNICNIKQNPMYAKGYLRVGCIGCPLGGCRSQMREFTDYPKYKSAYERAFDRMLVARRESGKLIDEHWKDGESVMDWWLHG